MHWTLIRLLMVLNSSSAFYTQDHTRQVTKNDNGDE